MKNQHRYLLIGISIFLITLFMATASFAQKKVKLVYWTHWSRIPSSMPIMQRREKSLPKSTPV